MKSINQLIQKNHFFSSNVVADRNPKFPASFVSHDHSRQASAQIVFVFLCQAAGLVCMFSFMFFTL